MLQIGRETKITLQVEYDKAYEDIRRFTESVDRLARAQRKVHQKILMLDELCDEKKFRKKLGRLRTKVRKNLKSSDAMLIYDKRLKQQFVKKVSSARVHFYTQH